MRQINNTPWPMDVPDIPARVLPGEEIDWPNPITGFTLLDPPQESAPPGNGVADQSPGAPPASPSSAKKTAVTEAPAAAADAADPAAATTVKE